MQLKITETTHHFNACKEKIDKASCFSYGSSLFILVVYGYRTVMYGFGGILYKVVLMRT